MFEAAEECLYDAFLEVVARILFDDLLPEFGRKVVEALTENVEADAGEEKCYSGLMYWVTPGVVWSAMASQAV